MKKVRNTLLLGLAIIALGVGASGCSDTEATESNLNGITASADSATKLTGGADLSDFSDRLAERVELTVSQREAMDAAVTQLHEALGGGERGRQMRQLRKQAMQQFMLSAADVLDTPKLVATLELMAEIRAEHRAEMAGNRPQQRGGRRGGGPGAHGPGSCDPGTQTARLEARVDFLTEFLDLSDEQSEAVTSILTELHAQMASLREERAAGPPSEEWIAQMDALRSDAHTSIAALLSDEQTTLFDALIALRPHRRP